MLLFCGWGKITLSEEIIYSYIFAGKDVCERVYQERGCNLKHGRERWKNSWERPLAPATCRKSLIIISFPLIFAMAARTFAFLFCVMLPIPLGEPGMYVVD